MIHRIKLFFKKIELSLKNKHNQRLDKSYKNALEIELLEKQCEQQQIEINKKRALVQKHSWMNKINKTVHKINARPTRRKKSFD